MITWMQKHKKYLVITIWISTIAFVGAGFVGWGAYDLNSNRSSSVAKIGNRNITIKDFQQTYQNIFSFYNNLSNGSLTQEKADAMGLRGITFSTLINENLLLNFADELNLQVLDEDIQNDIINNANFKKDGVFNKEQYYLVLQNLRLTPKDYENSLKKSILLNKLDNLLQLPVSKSEEQMLYSSFFMQDKLKIKTIQMDTNDIQINENELKTFWEQSKQNYQTNLNYVLKTYNVDLISTKNISEDDIKKYYEENKYDYKDENGEVMDLNASKALILKDLAFDETRTVALKKYLSLKKNEINFDDKNITIYENDTYFNHEVLKDVSVDEILKPVKTDDKYIIAKVIQINTPRDKTYEEAKKEAKGDYKKIKLVQKLEEKAKQNVSVFNGESIGFVNRDVAKEVQNLSKEEFAEFLSKLFEKDDGKKQGYVMLEDKAILYFIEDQKIFDEKDFESKKSLLSNEMKNLKDSILKQNLLEKLRQKYPIEQYSKIEG